MTIYLVRHTHAGNRGTWVGADWLRPLSERGQAQARNLVETLHHARFARIVSSPYVRCMESVVPLAGAHMLPIEPHDALAEGADVSDTLALIAKVAPEGAVLCSHGDVIPDLLGWWQARGLDLGSDPRCQKGSTWEIETSDSGKPRSARYVAPPPDLS